MACLKSQRRFDVLFIWQGVQLILSLPAYWFAARQGGALGVAFASALMWSISAPLGTWFCTRVDGRNRQGQIVRVFVRPWLIGLPVFVPGYLLVQWLAGRGRTGDIVAVVVAGPINAHYRLACHAACGPRIPLDYRSSVAMGLVSN